MYWNKALYALQKLLGFNVLKGNTHKRLRPKVPLNIPLVFNKVRDSMIRWFNNYLFGVISASCCCWTCWALCFAACLWRERAKNKAKIAFNLPSLSSCADTDSNPDTCWAFSRFKHRLMLSSWKKSFYQQEISYCKWNLESWIIYPRVEKIWWKMIKSPFFLLWCSRSQFVDFHSLIHCMKN